MTLVLLSAFRKELDGLLAAFRLPRRWQRCGFLRYQEGRVAGCAAVFAASGIGKVPAAAATQALCDRFQPWGIVLLGTAGSLAPEVRPLDLVVATETLAFDSGPWKPAWTATDGELSASLLACCEGDRSAGPQGSEVHSGRMVSADRPVLEAGERSSLAQRFSALAVDMESAAAAAVSQAMNVPLAVIKAITDRADAAGEADFRLNLDAAVRRVHDVVIRWLQEGERS